MIGRVMIFLVFLGILGYGIGGGVFVLKENVLNDKDTAAFVSGAPLQAFLQTATTTVLAVDVKTTSSNDLAPAPKEEKKAEKLVFKVSADTAEQGDVLIFKAIDLENTTSSQIQITVDDKKIKVARIGTSTLVGIYGIDVRETPKTIAVGLWQEGKKIEEKFVKIKKRDWSVTEFTLSESQKRAGYTPETAKQAINSDDNAILYEIFGKPDEGVYFDEPFVYPLPKEVDIVGAFGNIRKSGATEIRHLGVDLDATQGTPVYAAQNGTVRLARNLTNFGNTVVIDHGNAIFSLYLHLDSIKTTLGAQVKRGDEVGAVGNTGEYSLGPHLHFSVKIGGASVDPLRFLTVTKGVK